MKKITVRVIVFMLAAIMLVPVLSSCGGQKMTVKVTAQLGSDYIDYMYDVEHADDDEYTLPNEDRTLINGVDIQIEYAEGEQVSVYRALVEACANVGLNYTPDKNEYSITGLKDVYNNFGASDGRQFFWTYTVNGVEPTEGRMYNNYVKDGDVLVFTLTSASADDAK